MKKLLFILLLAVVLVASSCTSAQTTPTALPPTPALEEEPADSSTSAAADFGASEENPCVPFSILDQILVTPYPGLPEVTEDDWILGAFDAPVTFMEYSEPQCPYCAQLEPILTSFQNKYPNDVRVVFRYRPFPESFHDKSILGCQAMEAAGMQGKFQEFKNWLFERRSKDANNANVADLPDSEFWLSVAPDDFDEWLAERVADLGIDTEQFLEDMFSEEVVIKIQEAQASADALGIKGTPTLFINGFEWPEGTRGTEIFSVYTELLLHQENEFKECPQMLIDTAKSYSASIETTKGNIVVELFDDIAPYAVNSFVFLSNQGWYDNLPIIVNDQLILSGDPSNTGVGGAGYAYKDEINSNYNFSEPGMLATYSPFGPNLNGSMFLINKAAVEGQGGTTIFGKVLNGLEVVNSLTSEDHIIKITIKES